MTVTKTEEVYADVKSYYGYRAENEVNLALRARIASALGYDPISAASVPEAANIGEGCGNPLLIANLVEGETVVDLGSGGGFDCFLAAQKVGPKGKVIGIDMTEQMINLARKNAIKMNTTNVSFIHSRITTLPLESNSVDCIISNCVLNLVPLSEKPSVFAEIARVLKPGGRLAVSDFLAYKSLPQEIKEDPALLVGCVAGAVTVPEMQALLAGAGFEDTLLVDTHKDLGLYKDGETSKSVTPCCSSGGSEGDTACGPMQPMPKGRKPLDYDLNQWIAAFQIFAIKPAASLPTMASTTTAHDTAQTATPIPIPIPATTTIPTAQQQPATTTTKKCCRPKKGGCC